MHRYACLMLLVALTGCSDQAKPTYTMTTNLALPTTSMPTPKASNPDSASAAKALVEKAVLSQGGPDRLGKLRSFGYVAKGELFEGTDTIPASRDVLIAFPERLRCYDEMTIGTRKSRNGAGVNDGRVWCQVNGQTVDAPPPEAQEAVLNETFAYWMWTLIPLRETGVTLATAADETVDGQACAVLVVTAVGRPEVRLALDKSNQTVRKVSYLGREGALQALKEFVYADHQDVNGLSLPHKVTEMSNGRKVMGWTISAYRFPAQIDASEFAKPTP